jgi:hypothetical protein
MRWLLAIPFIFLGAILFSLTIDNVGHLVNLLIKITGLGCFLFADFIVRRKNEQPNRP